MNNFEKYRFIKEKLNAPRFDNEDEEIDWFTKNLYGLYNQASRLREENNNYMARIDKYRATKDKIKEYCNKNTLIDRFYNDKIPFEVIVNELNRLLEEIE